MRRNSGSAAGHNADNSVSARNPVTDEKTMETMEPVSSAPSTAAESIVTAVEAAPADSVTKEIRRWLSTEARSVRQTRDFLAQLCDRLNDAGVPVDRAMISIRTIHPQIIGTGYFWEAGAEVVTVNSGWDVLNDPDYLDSPLLAIHEGQDVVRSRISTGEVSRFPIVGSLKADGYTDYAMFALPFSDGSRNSFSIATKAAGGFNEAQFAFIEEIVPLVDLQVEVRAGWQVAEVLLDTYVGHQAGARVLAGDIRRGEGQTIQAVIFYADMRGFTAMSNDRPMGEVIATLNAWFDCAASAVERHGGQVLKFIGDGMLAIVPLVDAAFRHYACRQALQAAYEIEDSVAALNAARDANGLPSLHYRIGLHVGELVYGNIGATNRLDFTAIGPAVNLAARLEELAGVLDVPLLVSSDFAAVASEYTDFRSLGLHTVRGIVSPVEVFVPQGPSQPT